MDDSIWVTFLRSMKFPLQGSFPGIEKVDQFFGSPYMASGTGATMCDRLLEVLEEWSIPRSIIIGMGWDTTASNTGRLGGSATLFEQMIERAILWLACRHHIGELHIGHASNLRFPTKGKSINQHCS